MILLNSALAWLIVENNKNQWQPTQELKPDYTIKSISYKIDNEEVQYNHRPFVRM